MPTERLLILDGKLFKNFIMKEQGYWPFTLYIDDTPTKTNNPDVLPPLLITPVGMFQGIEKIRHYAPIHEGVDDYLRSRVPSAPPNIQTSLHK